MCNCIKKSAGYSAAFVVMSCLIVLGCKEEPRATLPVRGRPDAAASDLLGTEIKAGWGIESCHLGMSSRECKLSLGNPDTDTPIDEVFADKSMEWRDLGIMVLLKNDLVVQVYFKFSSHEYSPFPGRVNVRTDSDPMTAVSSKFGVPPEIEKSRMLRTEVWNGEPPGGIEYYDKHLSEKMQTWYNYPKLGIDISFLDDEVSYVWVYVPDE